MPIWRVSSPQSKDFPTNHRVTGYSRFMAIDTKQYVLVHAGTGELLSDATRVAPELVGAALYDLAGDLDALVGYSELRGVELHGPEGLDGDAVDLKTLEGYVAIDPDTGRTVSPSSLRLVGVDNLDTIDIEDSAQIAALARDAVSPTVTSEVHDLEPLPFVSVND